MSFGETTAREVPRIAIWSNQNMIPLLGLIQ